MSPISKQDHTHTHPKGLSLAFWLNLVFSVIEAIGGIMTNSTAIVADAFHDFMDAMAIGLAILAEKISGRQRTAEFSYGYRRFSLLSALALSIFLLVGAGVMIVHAYGSFTTPKEVDSVGMLWLAMLGLAVNGFAFLRVKRGDKQHLAHSHGGHNHNTRSIMLHLLEDVLGWAAVLIGAGIIYLTGWNWVDGVLTLGIALFIGINATKNLTGTLRVMLQSVPDDVNVSQLLIDLKEIDEVEDIHDVHVWSLDGTYHVGSLHAVIKQSVFQTRQREIMNKIVKLMQAHHIQHPTVQMETGTHSCPITPC